LQISNRTEVLFLIFLIKKNFFKSSPKSADQNSASESYDDDRLLSPSRNKYGQGDYSNLSSPRQNGYEGDHRLVRASGAGLTSFTPRKANEFVVDTSATGFLSL